MIIAFFPILPRWAFCAPINLSNFLLVTKMNRTGDLGQWPITVCKKIQLRIAFQHSMLISCSATPCAGFACNLNTKKRKSGSAHGPFDRPSWYLAAHAFCPRGSVSLAGLCRSRPFRVLMGNAESVLLIRDAYIASKYETYIRQLMAKYRA
jgi:hypothetical protein